MSEWPALLFNDMETSGPNLHLRAMPGSIAPLQSESVLVLTVPFTTAAHEDTKDQGPSSYLRTMLLVAMVTSRPSCC